MNAPDPRFPPNDAIESAAAEWLVRHDRGLTPAQQDEFLSWLTASTAHRESFERHRGLWGDFNALKQWRPAHSATPNPDLLARHHRPARWRRPLPLLFATAAAVALAFWLVPAAGPHDEGARGILRDGELRLALHEQDTALGGGKLHDDVGTAVQIEDGAVGEFLLAIDGGFESQRGIGAGAGGGDQPQGERDDGGGREE